MVSAGDAQQAFYIALGTYIPTAEEYCAADCNGDGLVSAGDAQGIFYLALGIGSCVDPILTKQEPVPQKVVSEANVIWIEEGADSNRNLVRIVIGIANQETDVDAFTFDLTYDASRLKYQKCESGDLNPDWILFDCIENAPGTIRTGAFAIHPVPKESDGSLVIFTFEVISDSWSVGRDRNFTISRLMDDLQGFTIEDASVHARQLPKPLFNRNATRDEYQARVVPSTGFADIGIMVFILSALS